MRPFRAGVAAFARPAFVVYALALFVATHWPGVTIRGPVPRPDLWVHAGAYALWTALLIVTGWCGPAGSFTTGGRALLIALAGAGLDELTQPFFSRTADLSDWLFDGLGIGAASLGMTLAARPRKAVRMGQACGERCPFDEHCAHDR